MSAPAVEPTELGDEPAAPRAHRPQTLLLSMLGGLVLDAELTPLPSVVVPDLLADLGVTEAAGRATSKRMTQRGLLERAQVGRTAEYARSPGGPSACSARPRSGSTHRRPPAIPRARGRCSATRCRRAVATCGTRCGPG